MHESMSNLSLRSQTQASPRSWYLELEASIERHQSTAGAYAECTDVTDCPSLRLTHMSLYLSMMIKNERFLR